MQTLSEIRALLEARGLRPKHRLGQNFLHDKNQLRKLIDAAHVQPGEVVLEVGPGTGTLTEALLERGAEVIACELDPDMSAIVRERLGDCVTLIEGDCLESGRRLHPAVLESMRGRAFALVANLPYHAASPLMAALALDHPECRGQFVTIQREVADRLLAEPGTKAYGPLTIIIRALADVERIGVLKPSCFWPPPQVDSAMVSIVPRTGASIAQDERQSFARFVTQLFTKRRKQLGTILGRDRAADWWPHGIDPEQRPETLPVEQVIALWRAAGTDNET